MVSEHIPTINEEKTQEDSIGGDGAYFKRQTFKMGRKGELWLNTVFLKEQPHLQSLRRKSSLTNISEKDDSVT